MSLGQPLSAPQFPPSCEEGSRKGPAVCALGPGQQPRPEESPWWDLRGWRLKAEWARGQPGPH